MINVINVLFDERVGGPQLRVLHVARQLLAHGFETRVVIPKGDPRFAALLRDAGIPCQEMNLVRARDTLNPVPHLRFAARFWPNVRALRRIIRRHGIEIVHTNGLMHLQAAIAARMEGVRLVWHLNDVETPPLVHSLLPAVVRAWADGIAIAAQAVGRHCFGNPAALNGRLHLLYAPVDIEKFRPDVYGAKVRTELGIRPGAPIIGGVANIGPGKGLEYLLEAVPLIKKRFREAKFLLVGEMLENRRAYWQRLLQRRGELGLVEDVVFTGRRSDMPEVYRAMSVFVQASEAEACPMAVLEASASGLPVVATQVGGTPELVQDGVTGLLIEARNPAQIAEAVVRLLFEPELARRMGLAGAERMRKLFSLDACVQGHVRLYESVLGRSPASADKTPSLETPLHR